MGATPVRDLIPLERLHSVAPEREECGHFFALEGIIPPSPT